MSSGTVLTEGAWDGLFDFLDPGRGEKKGPDRDRVAEAKCAEILRKLTCFFAGRGCADAEDLAMETILRAAGKCADVDVSGYEDRTGYFYGFARNVLHEGQRDWQRDSKRRESLRQNLPLLPVPDRRSWKDEEAVHRCLDRCMGTLNHRAQRLILRYYSEEKSAKIENHRRLAEEFGKSANALRIEVHRVRKTLRECVFVCLGPGDRARVGPKGAYPGD